MLPLSGLRLNVLLEPFADPYGQTTSSTSPRHYVTTPDLRLSGTHPRRLKQESMPERSAFAAELVGETAPLPCNETIPGFCRIAKDRADGSTYMERIRNKNRARGRPYEHVKTRQHVSLLRRKYREAAFATSAGADPSSKTRPRKRGLPPYAHFDPAMAEIVKALNVQERRIVHDRSVPMYKGPDESVRPREEVERERTRISDVGSLDEVDTLPSGHLRRATALLDRRKPSEIAKGTAREPPQVPQAPSSQAGAGSSGGNGRARTRPVEFRKVYTLQEPPNLLRQ